MKMEQGRGKGRGVESKASLQHQQHPPPQQPQKCPRCDSVNTKFCYYNNYSLSQPRYFCKTCRRYWTQGGTLRNVPVGGGCRKGNKRLKRSSSPTSSSDNLLGSSSAATSIGSLRSKGVDISLPSSPMVPIMQPSMYFPGGGGGFLPSLATSFQSLDQSLNIGGGEFGVSSLGLFQGYGLPFHTHHQQQHQQQLQQLQQQQEQQQQQFYLEQSHNLNMGGTSGGTLEEKVRPASPHQEWSNSISETTDYWNTNNNNNTGVISNDNTGTSTSVGVLLHPPQPPLPHWTDNLPDFTSPPLPLPPPPPQSPLAITTSTSSPPSFL